MTTIKWNTAAFMTLQEPTAYPTHVRENPTAISTMLYALDEKQQSKAAKTAATRKAKARVGVKVFSWEMGQ